jgi:PAS domain S-box-containing protein
MKANSTSPTNDMKTYPPLDQARPVQFFDCISNIETRQDACLDDRSAPGDLFDIVIDRAPNRISMNKVQEVPQYSFERFHGYLQVVLNEMPDGCILTDQNFRVIFWNPAATRILGFEPEQVIGRLPSESFLPSLSIGPLRQQKKRVLESMASVDIVLEARSVDGRAVLCSWHVAPILRENNIIRGFAFLFQDNGEKRRIEEELRKARESDATPSSAQDAPLVQDVSK